MRITMEKNWNLNIWISLLLLLFSSCGVSQVSTDSEVVQDSDSLSIEQTYSVKSLSFEGMDSITNLASDGKGNYFISDDKNSLYKFADSKNISNVNTKVFGSINKIDCSNPFEIYSYHMDQNIVVYYDNMLNIRGETRLNDVGFSNISAMARSYDNGLWIFNMENFQLQKINKAGEILAESYNLLTLLRHELNIIDIKEFDNKVYLLDSEKGVLQFDLFGTHITTFYLDNVEQIEMVENGFIYVADGKISNYNFISRDIISLNMKVPTDYVLLNGFVYEIKGGTLIYFSED